MKETSQMREILYPHEVVSGKRRAIDLSKHPKSATYLESHREQLEGRKYVIDAGRNWYEIWVPQDPGSWEKTKLVFRDISEEPIFWIDDAGSVVNGDCYWLVANDEKDVDLLWLACAVGNSRFIEEFYDHRFHNKLYSGRRRFITQYVELFPLPDPSTEIARKIIGLAREVFAKLETDDAGSLEVEIDALVSEAFGLGFEEVQG